MAQKITYTAAQKKLVKFEWSGRGHGAGAIRAEKMVRPICQECYNSPDALVGWWDTCEHDPYFSLKPHVIKTPRYETDEDGDMVLVETATRTKMVREPNITEIIDGPRSNDGRGVEKKRRYGFKSLPEIGYAPMCQMYGCGRTFPVLSTAYGNYCNENHAKLVAADILEVKFTINRPDIRRQEMAAINV